MTDPEMSLVPIAIREGVHVRLHFPVDLTKAEAEKVCRVVMAYAVDDRSEGEVK